MNFAAFLLSGRDRSDRPAIVTPTSSISYAQLITAVQRLSAHLVATIGTGEAVGLVAANSVFYVTAYLACLLSGNVAVPLDRAMDAEALAGLLRRARVRLVFADPSRSGKLAEVFGPCGPRIVTEDETAGWTDSGLGGPTPVHLAPRRRGSDPAVILFTSGTTGDRKGVVLSHRNLIANTASIIRALNLTAADRSCVVLPFHYCYGASVLHTHLKAGGSLFLANPVFTGALAKDCAAFECTNLAGVPTTFATMTGGGDAGWDRAGLRLVTQAGGRMAPDLLDRVLAAMPDTRLAVMYGQTEATARLAVLPPELLSSKRGTAGRAIPGVTLRVVDDRGRSLRPGEPGEITAFGANVMLGYLDDPEATAQALRGRWLRTGDLGRMDRDGFVTVLGRRDELVKCRGYRIQPQEVEDVMAAHPAVTACAVVGVEDADWGQALAAFVVSSWPELQVRTDLKRFCRERLPAFTHPKFIRILPALPLTASAKVDRGALRLIAARDAEIPRAAEPAPATDC